MVRLKRHRDKLIRDQTELSRVLAETRLELQAAQDKAAETQVRGTGVCLTAARAPTIACMRWCVCSMSGFGCR